MKILFFDEKLEEFIGSLEKAGIAKALRTVDLLKRFGNKLGMPHSKKIAKGLFELRIRGEEEARIIYTFHRDSIVLLHGFKKKSQKIPHKEVNTAHKKLRDLDKT